MTTVPLKDSPEPIQAYLAEPKTKAIGGLILIHEAWGLNDHITDVADRFAAEGYVVLAPQLLEDQEIIKHAEQLQTDLFDPAKRNDAQARMRELMAPLHDETFVHRTVVRLKASFDWLAARDDVDGRVGVVGFSFGGTYALQLAAEEPLLDAAVSFYGHAPMREGKLQWITCPVLAFYGERDENLIKQLPEVEQAMHDADVTFEAKVFADAGHAFFNDTNENAYHEKSAKDAWLTTLDFLQRTVADTPSVA